MMAASRELSAEDRLVRSRNRMLLGSAAAFGLWQLGDLLSSLTGGAAQVAFKALSGAGLVAWGALLVLVMRGVRQIKHDARLRAIAEDERANDVRLRAYRLAFCVTIGVAALLGVPAIAQLLPALAISRVLVVVGIATFVTAFVILDGEE